ncbi:hypothetical protein [Hymenobacter glacieicola]|uniref:Tail fiber protein n=1 Tax=Hymenobacter glacieicola TaxID=1562124 RepID=A0ABQ1WK61_9BACT|nr:hypothetical protein [Hymenobacter glacieicola]GGG33480.1 hypothetical protein GCM10011378_07440 [Hymenobacter glacieicola]
MSQVLHGDRIFNGTVSLNKLAPDAQAAIAGGMTAAQVDAKLNELKMLLFGGEVPAALDTFRELAEALSTDRTGLNALTLVVNGKATPADLKTAVDAAVAMLLGGASDDSNTLKKLEVMVKAAQQAAVNAIADGAVTNAKLGSDVKIGSINAAQNAYPVTVQAGLTSVEKFLVYLGQQLSSVLNSVQQNQTSLSNHETRLVAVEQGLQGKASQNDLNSLGNRVSTLEARPAGSTSPTGTALTDGAVENRHLAADVKIGGLDNANTTLGTAATSVTSLVIAVRNLLLGTATANYNTLGKIETKITALENATGGGFVDVFAFSNLVAQTRSYFRTQTLKKVYKDAGTASVSYAKNGGGAVAVPFNGDVATINIPLVAGDKIVWAITYANGFTDTTIEVEGA